MGIGRTVGVVRHRAGRIDPQRRLERKPEKRGTDYREQLPVKLLAVLESHLGLGRMNVDIDQLGVDF